jgi:hypothetical protein
MSPTSYRCSTSRCKTKGIDLVTQKKTHCFAMALTTEASFLF